MVGPDSENEPLDDDDPRADSVDALLRSAARTTQQLRAGTLLAEGRFRIVRAHCGQNLALALSGSPHCLQWAPSPLLQTGHAVAPTGMSCPQLAQALDIGAEASARMHDVVGGADRGLGATETEARPHAARFLRQLLRQ